MHLHTHTQYSDNIHILYPHNTHAVLLITHLHTVTTSRRAHHDCQFEYNNSMHSLVRIQQLHALSTHTHTHGHTQVRTDKHTHIHSDIHRHTPTDNMHTFVYTMYTSYEIITRLHPPTRALTLARTHTRTHYSHNTQIYSNTTSTHTIHTTCWYSAIFTYTYTHAHADADAHIRTNTHTHNTWLSHNTHTHTKNTTRHSYNRNTQHEFIDHTCCHMTHVVHSTHTTRDALTVLVRIQ